MKFSLASIVLMGVSASAVDLTADNFDEMTAGKVVFLKMFAPWCGHCKKMKPDWDKLMDDFKDSETQLIADVDCTAEGKPVCDSNGVKGFPTLKFGDPTDLQDYQGARTYEALKKFIEEDLKPSCSPANLDLCDEDQAKEINQFMDMDDAKLDGMITEKEEEIKTTMVMMHITY